MHLAESIPETRCRAALIGRQAAHRLLHVAFELREFLGHLLPLFRERLGLLAADARLPQWRGRAALRTEHLLHLTHHLLLLPSQIFGALGDTVELIGRLLAAHPAEQITRFIQPLRGAARFRVILLGGGGVPGGAAHIFGGLPQPFERLLHARINAGLLLALLLLLLRRHTSALSLPA